MNRKVIASTSGIASATTSPARMPRRHEADGENDGHGFEQGAGEAGDSLFDDERLIGDKVHADAHGRSAVMRVISSARLSPNSSKFAPGFMPMARPMAFSPLKRNSEVGGST